MVSEKPREVMAEHGSVGKVRESVPGNNKENWYPSRASEGSSTRLEVIEFGVPDGI